MVAQRFNSQVWQFDDGVTWTRGGHTLKIGGEFMFDIIKVFYSGNSGQLGNMTFGPIFTAVLCDGSIAEHWRRNGGLLPRLAKFIWSRPK